MGIAPTTLTSAARAATIKAVAGELAQHAVSPFHPIGVWGARLEAPTLLSLSAAQARAGVDELTRLLPWVDDGNCFARGAVGAARFEQLLGGTARDAATGALQAHAGVAVVGTSAAKTGWTFHAATVYRDSARQLQVVDRLLEPKTGVLTLEAWAAKVGRRASDVRIQQSVDNIPTGSGPLTVPAAPFHLRQMGRELVRSLPAD